MFFLRESASDMKNEKVTLYPKNISIEFLNRCTSKNLEQGKLINLLTCQPVNFAFRYDIS